MLSLLMVLVFALRITFNHPKKSHTHNQQCRAMVSVSFSTYICFIAFLLAAIFASDIDDDHAHFRDIDCAKLSIAAAHKQTYTQTIAY